MKAKILAAMMAVLLSLSFAAAQAYYISTNYNTNLRESGSLNARIVETVARGTTLHVVGNAGRWLQISRNGSQLWMADWVSHDRVDGSQDTASQPASNIDNCCFVDRQCNSDQEWTDGYWAFQNGQCAAPVQTQTQTSNPPVTSTVATVDNCCFVDRQCNTDAEWTNGYWAFQNNQCSAPVQAVAIDQAGCAAPLDPAAANLPRPVVDGPDRFVRRVNNVLDWLQRRAPEWYVFVITGGTRITQSTVYGKSFARLSHREMHIDPTSAFRGEGRTADYIILASILAHEACHIHDYDAGVANKGWDWEIRAEGRELDVLNALDPYGRYDAIDYLKRGAEITIISMERGWLASQLNKGN